jgi:O-antigen ligase
MAAHERQLEIPWPLAAAAIALGVVGTAVAVSRSLGGGNEAFIVPKALVLAVCATLAALLLVRQNSYRPTSFDAWLWAGVVHGFFSAVLGSPNWASAATVLLPEWSALLLLALVSAAAGEDRARRGRVLDLIVVAMTVVAALALLESVGVNLPWESVRRPHSTLGNRNFVGAGAAVASAIAGCRLLERRSVLRTLGFAVLVAAVVVTRCRSAWLSLAVGLGTMLALGLVLRPRLPRRAAGYLATVLFLSVVGAALTPWPGLHWNDSLSGTAARLLDYQGGTGRERLTDLKIATTIAIENPFFGVGPRSWDDAASARAHESAGRHATPQHFWTTPNSDLARILAERGFVGLALFAGTLGSLLAGVWSARQRDHLETIALASAASALLVDTLLDAPLFGASTLAMAAALGGLARKPGPRALAVTWPARVGLPVLATAILLVTSLRTASSALLASDAEGISTAQRALRWFPRPDVTEVLALRLASAGRCQEAELAGAAALELAPHHWGVPHALSECWLSQGNRVRAREHRAERDRLEPHVQALFSRGADAVSGYDATAGAPRRQ